MTVTATPHPPLDVELLVRRTEALLRAGVPLSLLLDLAEPTGPHSREVYANEPGDADWLVRP